MSNIVDLIQDFEDDDDPNGDGDDDDVSNDMDSWGHASGRVIIRRGNIPHLQLRLECSSVNIVLK